MTYTEEKINNIILELENNGEAYKDYTVHINKNYASFWDIIHEHIPKTISLNQLKYVSISIWFYFGGGIWDTLLFKNHYEWYKEIEARKKQTEEFTQQYSKYSEPEKETKMAINTTIPVQQITYVFGKDVESMSEAELIHAIKQVESEVEQLSSVKTKSAKIALRISEHKETLQKLAKLLDNK